MAADPSAVPLQATRDARRFGRDPVNVWETPRIGRRDSAIGLVLCPLIVQMADMPTSELRPSALWRDLGLLGAIVFLVLLCIGPRRKQEGDNAGNTSAR